MSEPENFKPLESKGLLPDEIVFSDDDKQLGPQFCTIPIQLSGEAPHQWCEIFMATWHTGPMKYSGSFPRGRAEVLGDKIYIHGARVEDFEGREGENLKKALKITNERYQEYINKLREEDERKKKEAKEEKELQDKIRQQASDIKLP